MNVSSFSLGEVVNETGYTSKIHNVINRESREVIPGILAKVFFSPGLALESAARLDLFRKANIPCLDFAVAHNDILYMTDLGANGYRLIDNPLKMSLIHSLHNATDLSFGMARDLGRIHHLGYEMGTFSCSRCSGVHPPPSLWIVRHSGYRGERVVTDVANLDVYSGDVSSLSRDFMGLCNGLKIDDEDVLAGMLQSYMNEIGDRSLQGEIKDEIDFACDGW